jgi:hypothetical protein
VLTLRSLVDASDATLRSSVPHEAHFLRIQSSIKEVKMLFPEWFDLVPPAGIRDRSAGWRLSRILVHMGRFVVMKIEIQWTYLSLVNGRVHKHKVEMKSTPTMSFEAAVNNQHRTVQVLDLAQDEYLTGVTVREGVEWRLVAGIEFRTSKHKKLKCCGEMPQYMTEVHHFNAPEGGSAPYGIVGFKVGFKRLDNFSGVSNLVCMCSALSENPHLAYLPDEAELDFESTNPYHRQEEVLQIPSQQIAEHSDIVTVMRNRTNRRRIDEVTGEYEDEEMFEPPSATMPPAPPPSSFSIPAAEAEAEGFTSSEGFTSIPPKSQLAKISPSSIATAEFRASFLVGPISYATFCDPVVLIDGHTYEKNYITRWLADHKTSPMTGEVLLTTKLKTNGLVKKLLEDVNGKTQCGAAAPLSECESKLRVMNLLTCPLSKRIFRDPVLFFGDGMTYEKRHLEEFLEASTHVGKLLNPFLSVRSPTTGAKVNDVSFVPNYVIKSLLDHARNERVERNAEVEPTLIDEEEELRVPDEVIKPGVLQGVLQGDRKERSRTNSFDEMWVSIRRVGVFVQR